MSKVKRTPKANIENYIFTLTNENKQEIKCNLSFTIYEPFKDKDGNVKKWSRVGNGNIIIADLVKIKLGILENTDDQTRFFTWPKEKSKGKYWPTVMLDKNHKDYISSLINQEIAKQELGIEQIEQEQEQEPDVPWELEL